jgi:hypothetical protein
MIITVQCVPERIEYIKKQLKDIPEDIPIVYHIDTEKSGSYNSFCDMLNLDLKDSDYRLHFQDDVILSNAFWGKINFIEKVMKSKDIHVLSLYAPNRKHLIEQFQQGKTIVQLDNFLGLVCCVFSKEFVAIMKLLQGTIKEKKHDDVFVREALRISGIKAYVMLPSLIQHNLEIRSAMGHHKNVKRQSPLFIEDLKKT